jgi:hypothetical protein
LGGLALSRRFFLLGPVGLKSVSSQTPLANFQRKPLPVQYKTLKNMIKTYYTLILANVYVPDRIPSPAPVFSFNPRENCVSAIDQGRRSTLAAQICGLRIGSNQALLHPPVAIDPAADAANNSL